MVRVGNEERQLAWPKGVPHRPEMIAARLVKITGKPRRPHSPEGRINISIARQRYLAGLPKGSKAPPRTGLAYRRDVEDLLNVRLDPKTEVVHHLHGKKGGDQFENLAVLPRGLHAAAHNLEAWGVAVDLGRFSVLNLKEAIDGERQRTEDTTTWQGIRGFLAGYSRGYGESLDGREPEIRP